MDLREKKTRRSIAQAFMRLRKSKPLERITVRELAEQAEISKATFYLHYRDIFDLSESLQKAAIREVLAGIAHPELLLQDRQGFLSELLHSIYARQAQIEILFSGTQASALPGQIDRELRDLICRLRPGLEPAQEMLLTYQIQGSFSVYQTYHKKYGADAVIRLLGELAQSPGHI